jgi:hypothetical protein
MEIPTKDQDLLEVARAAARAQSVARRDMRERVFRERQRLASTLQDSRTSLGPRLLSGARIGQAELDSMQKRQEETVRAFIEEERRAIAGRPRSAGRDQRLRSPRRSPFPDAPQLGYKLIQLDTATFIGPPVEQTGSHSRNLVAPDPPAPGRNFARAFVEIDSGHRSGFDVEHLNSVLVDFFFAFTPDSDIQMNSAGFVDWNGGYTEFAGWYPFDHAWAQATFTLGMDIFVVNAQGRLVETISATPDQGFDKRIDVGPFDFAGAYDSFTYSTNSSFFVNGVGVKAGNRVFFRVWTELTVTTKSVAYAQVDFGSGDLGIDVTGVFAWTFPAV